MWEHDINPPDPVVWGQCDQCGDDIEVGQDIVRCDLGIVHEDCWDDFAREKLSASNDVAGGMQ